jgi:hypothetical protein
LTTAHAGSSKIERGRENLLSPASSIEYARLTQKLIDVVVIAVVDAVDIA